MKAEDFELGEVYATEWYGGSEKARKSKLGSLRTCKLQGYEKPLLCRVMKFERITSYQFEGYFSELARIHMLKLTKHVIFPRAVLMDETNTIHLFASRKTSLFEWLHKQQKSEASSSPYTKLVLLLHLARILNTFHSLKPLQKAHGHLSSHNVFVEVPADILEVENTKVQVAEFELGDLNKYANMFYSYRNASVWSPPEVLRNPKKLLEPSFAMDVYSFGLIMWEIFHELVPFDGDLKAATELVLQEDIRPAIAVEDPEEDESDDERDPTLTSPLKPVCSAPVAALIRACWQSDPAKRPSFAHVIEQLHKEKLMYSQAEESGLEDSDSEEEKGFRDSLNDE